VKLTVIAATGGIGRQLLTQAVAAGHDVTAVVRYMLHAIDEPETFRQTVGIAN
jgi:putative NADH-flavin reductase